MAHLTAGTRLAGNNNVNRWEESPITVNTSEPIAPSWLDRQVGFQLAHEQFTVPELLELGIAAEQAGFDLLANSDHLQPWQTNEGHAGQAWFPHRGACARRTYEDRGRKCRSW